MKQPKKITRSIRELIEFVRPDLDMNNYMLADETKSVYVIQHKITKELITIRR